MLVSHFTSLMTTDDQCAVLHCNAFTVICVGFMYNKWIWINECLYSNLHVKLEMPIAHANVEELQNLSNLNCCLQIRQIWIQLMTACGYCKRRCTELTHITDLELSTTPLTNGCRKDMIQLGSHPAPPTTRSVVVSVCPDQLYTSFAIVITRCNHLDSNLANLEAGVEVG